MKKVIKIAALVAVVLAIGLWFAQGIILKKSFIWGTQQVLGTDVSIHSLSFNPFRGHIALKDLVIGQPEGYEGEPLFSSSEISLDVRVRPLLSKDVQIKQMTLYLDEVTLIKNAQGELNVNKLKVAQKSDEEAPKKEKTPEDKSSKEPSEPISFQADLLRLKIGKVTYKDYSSGKESIKTYDLNIEKELRDIKSLKNLSAMIIVEIMKETAIKGALSYGFVAALGPAGIPVALLGGEKVTNTLQEAGSKVSEGVQNVLQKGLGFLSKTNE